MVQSGRQQSASAPLGTAGAFPAGPFTISTTVKDYASVRGRLGFAFDRFLAFGTAGWAWGNPSIAYALVGAAPFVNQGGRAMGWTAGVGVDYTITGKRFCAHRISLHQSCHCGLCECGNQFGRPSHSGAGQRFARRYRIQVRDPRRGEFLIGLSAVLAEIRVQITPGTRAPALSLFMDVRVAATRSMCALAVGLLARKRWKSAALSTRS